MNEYIISRHTSGRLYAHFKGRFWRWDEAQGIWLESHLMHQKYVHCLKNGSNTNPQGFLTDPENFEPLDEYEIPCGCIDALKSARPCKNAPIDPVEEDPECATVPNADAAATTEENAAPSAAAEIPTTSESAADASASSHGLFQSRSASVPTVPADSTSVTPSAPRTLTNATGAIQTASPTAPTFDFGADDQTNALLLQDAQTFITGNMARIMAAKHAHDLCANNKNGTWGKWCATVGISRDTGDRFVNIAAQCGNIQLEGKSILDVQPLKLLYAAAKPSTPEMVKQAVFTGDITTYKEYQDLMAQLKAEKSRADSAEAREIEARQAAHTYHVQLEETTASRDSLLDQQGAYIADINALTDRADKAEARAKDAENQLSGSRQVAEAAKLRAEKLQAENTALKKQPITAVVDEEEVDRRAGEKAYQMAADMTAELKAQLKQSTANAEQDARNAYDGILLAGRTITNAWQAAKLLFAKLPAEQRETAANQLVHTLGQIQGEVSKCL